MGENRRRLRVNPRVLEAAVGNGLLDGGDVLGPKMNGVVGWVRSLTRACKGDKISETFDSEDGRSVDEVTLVEESKLRKSIKPRHWDFRSDEDRRCSGVSCPHEAMPLKTTQLLFQVVYDVEGGRTRSLCFDCWYARDEV